MLRVYGRPLGKGAFHEADAGAEFLLTVSMFKRAVGKFGEGGVGGRENGERTGGLQGIDQTGGLDGFDEGGALAARGRRIHYRRTGLVRDDTMTITMRGDRGGEVSRPE